MSPSWLDTAMQTNGRSPYHEGSVLDGDARMIESWDETPRTASTAEPTGDNVLTLLSNDQTGSTIDVSSSRESDGGLHALTKATDFWFDLEISRIEKKAVEEAEKWARAGLPRHDLLMEEDLPIETSLAKLCGEVYRRWMQKVKTKVQDAVEDAGQQAANAVSQFRHRIGALERTAKEAERVEREANDIEHASRDRETTFGYRSLLSKWKYAVLIGLLVVVDWVANVPIFSELLPQEPGATESWSELASNAEQYGLWAGLYRLAARLAFSPDVTVLALGVILFLMFLGHVFGESMRALIALRSDDNPDARGGIEAHRRQFPILAWASGVGIVLVLAALSLSRLQIEKVTEQRFQKATQEVAQIETALQTAQASGNAQGIQDNTKLLGPAREELRARQERFDYATGITAMNLPIFLLNLVLVISAAVAAYLSRGESVTKKNEVDPRLVELRATLARLRTDADDHRHALQELDGEIQTQLARVNYLLNSDPLHGWEGKTERLRRVIPLFRAENARERGMDPASIASFQRPPVVNLPEVPRVGLLSVPADLEDVVRDYQQLRVDAARLGRGLRILRTEDIAA